MLYSNSDLESNLKNNHGIHQGNALLSLLDMLRFYAASFATVIGEIRGAVCTLSFIDSMNVKSLEVDVAGSWKIVEDSLEGLAKDAAELPLSFAVKEQIKRVRETAKNHDDYNVVITITMIKELHNNIINDLTQHLFFLVPSNLKGLYTNPELLFGTEVENMFPEARNDLHHALRCFVLDEWTASVFHSMRGLEHGLRWLAVNIGLTIHNLELENWKVILDQIEKKIRSMEQLPKSEQKTEDIKFFSEAASNFRFFKDAWRNHVSHARATYDESDAHRVLTHVSDFLKHLVKRV